MKEDSMITYRYIININIIHVRFYFEYRDTGSKSDMKFWCSVNRKNIQTQQKILKP